MSGNPDDGASDQSGKVLIAIICLVGGFVFPPLWFGAAIALFGVWAETRRSTPSKTDARFPHLEEGAHGWQSKARECMDSPAEDAFFDAMTKAFDLRPADQCFRGNGLTLRMQVSVLRYRLDFLVDDTLVVEIDGAEWHGSPEAMARDQARDKNLDELGYTVLRIPAKIAIYDPDEAVRRVRDMRPKAANRQEQEDRANRQAFRRSFNPVRLARTANATLDTFAEKTAEASELAQKYRAQAEERAQKEVLEKEARRQEEERRSAERAEVLLPQIDALLGIGERFPTAEEIFAMDSETLEKFVEITKRFDDEPA